VAILGAGGGMGTSRAQYHLRQSCVYLDLHPLNKPEVFANAFAGGFDAEGNLTDERLQGWWCNSWKPASLGRHS
jgi:chromate reductase